MTTVDLELYFNRIGFTGDPLPNIEVLEALQLMHLQSIPFENIDPFLGIPVYLSPMALQRKLIENKRGGYCFEHNLLLKNVLEQIGFSVSGLAARVRWQVEAGTVTPASHMMLKVEVNEIDYLVDAGFGGQVPTVPLKIVPNLIQATPHGDFRIVVENNYFVLQAKVIDSWLPVYSFDYSERYQSDYEVINYYLCNSYDSHFVRNLMIALPAEGHRKSLRTNLVGPLGRSRSENSIVGTFRKSSANEPSISRDLDSAFDVIQALETEFSLPNLSSRRLATKLGAS